MSGKSYPFLSSPRAYLSENPFIDSKNCQVLSSRYAYWSENSAQWFYWNLWIAENSTDPNEIAEAFEREKQNSPAANLTEWQKATLGVRFTPESFRRHGDWNNMTRTMAKAWISNDGVGIDQFVKDNSPIWMRP